MGTQGQIEEIHKGISVYKANAKILNHGHNTNDHPTNCLWMMKTVTIERSER